MVIQCALSLSHKQAILELQSKGGESVEIIFLQKYKNCKILSWSIQNTFGHKKSLDNFLCQVFGFIMLIV